LILLHGYGADEHDLLGLAPNLDPRFDIRSVQGPVALQQGGRAWFNLSIQGDGTPRFDLAQAEASRKTLLRFIFEAVAADEADPERVYLAGFSQGAMLAEAIALTVPQRVAGVVGMSGRIPGEVQAQAAPAEALTGLPILVVHGTQDPLLPIENGRASQAFLSKLPVALTYREFPMAHQISPDSLRTVTGWLTARLNGPRRELTSQ
jgi:phospholipase/carboxylesterase